VRCRPPAAEKQQSKPDNGYRSSHLLILLNIYLRTKEAAEQILALSFAIYD